MSANSIIPVITGPTASGKSGLLHSLFEEGVSFEIISADAFQVYKGLDIGTAKPECDILQKVPHHLIDIVPADGAYDAGDFVEQAEPLITEILSRGKLPIVSGGTGMYIQSLRDGLFETPAADVAVRAQISQRLEIEGRSVLFKELEGIDPVYAARIHENDLVRIVRALEVWKTTGLPISQAHEKFRRKPQYRYKIMVIGTERPALYAGINTRVKEMLEKGWLDEIEALLSAGITTDMLSFRAIGYRELAQVLVNNVKLEDAEALTAQKTRNYAKRQMTWFRGMHDVEFMSAEEIKNGIKKAR